MASRQLASGRDGYFGVNPLYRRRRNTCLGNSVFVSRYKDNKTLLSMSYTDDLKETNRLIREVVLPELVNIRGELDELRRHTWPYVQAQKESTQLSDIRTKRLFSQHLDDEELVQLLKMKAFLSKTGTSLVMREFDLIRNNHRSDTFSQ